LVIVGKFRDFHFRFLFFFSFLKSPGSSRAVVFSLDRRDRLQFFVSSFPSHIPIFFKRIFGGFCLCVLELIIDGKATLPEGKSK
jgi:hypothetical protein